MIAVVDSIGARVPEVCCQAYSAQVDDPFILGEIAGRHPDEGTAGIAQYSNDVVEIIQAVRAISPRSRRDQLGLAIQLEKSALAVASSSANNRAVIVDGCRVTTAIGRCNSQIGRRGAVKARGAQSIGNNMPGPARALRGNIAVGLADDDAISINRPSLAVRPYSLDPDSLGPPPDRGSDH